MVTFSQVFLHYKALKDFTAINHRLHHEKYSVLLILYITMLWQVPLSPQYLSICGTFLAVQFINNHFFYIYLTKKRAVISSQKVSGLVVMNINHKQEGNNITFSNHQVDGQNPHLTGGFHEQRAMSELYFKCFSWMKKPNVQIFCFPTNRRGHSNKECFNLSHVHRRK